MSTVRYCRLCLKNDVWNSPMPIFVKDFSLSEKVRNVLGIEIRENDSLPQVICHLCLGKISLLDEFLIQVKNSNNLLMSLITTTEVAQNVPLKTERTNPKSVLNSGELKVNVEVVNPPSGSSRRISTNENVDKLSKPDESQQKPSTTEVKEFQKSRSNALLKKIKKNVVAKKSTNKVTLYKCSKCRYKTPNEKAYKVHINNSFNCSICQATFCSLKGMKIHRKAAHKLQKTTSLSTSSNDKETNQNDDQNSNNEGNVKYQWCKVCDKVFLTDEEFNKHNDEFHTPTQTKDKDKPQRVKPGPKRKKQLSKNVNSFTRSGSNSSSDSDASNSSTESTKNTPGTSKRKRGSKQKQVFSPIKAKLTCWKCKGIFDTRENLFTHKCTTDYTKMIEEKDSDSSVNENEEVSPAKRKLKKVFSSSEDNINTIDDGKRSDDEEIKNSKVSVKKSTSKLNCLSDDTESDVEITNFKPSYEKSKTSVNSVYDEDGDSGDVTEVIDGSTVHDNSKVSVNTDDEKPSVLKKCNECCETFPSMKALVHHKRVHKAPLSDFFSFSLNKE